MTIGSHRDTTGSFGCLFLSFSLPDNQKPGFFRLIGVEDNSDEETQVLCDQETGGSVSSYFNPVPSGCCNRGMVCFPVRLWSHAYDLCGKANPRTMWLWESMRSFSKAFPSCYRSTFHRRSPPSPLMTRSTSSIIHISEVFAKKCGNDCVISRSHFHQWMQKPMSFIRFRTIQV